MFFGHSYWQINYLRNRRIFQIQIFLILGALRQHSLLTSTIAREIAPSSDIATAAMTSGLLHDVGKIIVALEKPDLMEHLVTFSDAESCHWVDAETEKTILGCTHAEVGGCFLNLWGVPTSVVEAVTFHDNPSSIYSRDFDVVGIVHVSNYLAHWATAKDGAEIIEQKLDREYLDKLLISDKEELWKEYTMEIYCEAA